MNFHYEDLIPGIIYFCTFMKANGQEGILQGTFLEVRADQLWFGFGNIQIPYQEEGMIAAWDVTNYVF